MSSQESKPKGNLISNFRDDMRNPKKRAIYTYSSSINLAYNFIGYFVSTVTNIFLTDVAKLGVIMAGGMQIIQSFIKIAVAPITGTVFDKQPFKKGKYYPWLRYAPAALALTYGIFFIVPLMKISPALLLPLMTALLLIASCAQQVVFTIIYAIYPVVAKTPRDRVIGSTTTNIFKEVGKFLVGFSYPLLLVLFADVLGGEGMGYLGTYLFFAAGCLLVFWFSSTEIIKSGAEEEVLQKEEKPKIKASEMAKALFTNVTLMMAFCLEFLICIRSIGLGPLAPYYFKYVIEDERGLAVFLSIMPLVSVAFMFFAPVFIKICREQKLASIISFSICALCHLLVAWTPWGKTTLGVTMLLAIGGGFSNVVSIINLNFFAGSCDYGHWKSGKDLPGLSMSLYPVAIQVGVLLATTIRTVLMNSMGYQADMVVTEAVKSGFINMISYSMAIPLIIAVVIAILYPVSDKKLNQIREELNRRNA
ncbi:TPA: MFS transporter [Clostridioides difficile]|nr:MFS transporter [Clostridioides difficile]HBF4267044.1 MFS transporter [Clostridioides difficile]